MENLLRQSAADTNKITRDYFDEILIEMRHIDSVIPDTTLNLYGKTFKTPIMMAALSHLKGMNGEGDGLVQMAEGAKMSGAVNWVGMSDKQQFSAISATGASTIQIIKPYADESEVLKRIEYAEEMGALAIGMDVDHAFSSNGTYDNVLGYPMRPRSLKEIEVYCKRTTLPFIVKGVISSTDAKKCLEAGVRGIVVSHHHGISPTITPPLMVLPEIVKVIDNQIPIFVDCGIMNGTDAFKALAIGATAVSIGQPVMKAISKSGTQGAADIINEVTAELCGIMARTCNPSLSEIDASVLWRRSGIRY